MPVESRVWDASENLTWAQPCQIICRLGLAQPPAADGSESKMQHSCFVWEQGCSHLDLQTGTAPVCAESSDPRLPLFPVTTKLRPPWELLPCWCPYPTCLFAAVYNKLAGGGWGCCVSPPEHPAHLIPAFCIFVFCPFSILHSPS
jgi:hypothetical protein